jgi:hypothetical protein
VDAVGRGQPALEERAGSAAPSGGSSTSARTSSTASSRRTKRGDRWVGLRGRQERSRSATGSASQTDAAAAETAAVDGGRVPFGVERVEIRIDPANEASLRVPRSLGFAEEATLRRRLPAREGQTARDAVVFTLFSDELDGSPAARCEMEAFDVLGRLLAL